MTVDEVLLAAGLAGYLARLGHSGVVERDANGCAVWPLGKTTGGYGTWYPDDTAVYVHRTVYEAVVDSIPEGWHVDHVWARGCRSRACFWPEHLEAVTQAENARRAGEARRGQGPRSCGHSWDEDRSGRSDCAACHREDEAARKAPKKAAYARALATRTAQIKELHARGFSRNDIATEVGCSVETVRRTLLGLMKRY